MLPTYPKVVDKAAYSETTTARTMTPTERPDEFRGRLPSGKAAIAVGGDSVALGLTAVATIAHLAATKGPAPNE